MAKVRKTDRRYRKKCAINKDIALSEHRNTFTGEGCRYCFGIVRYVKNNKCIECYFESGLHKDWEKRKKHLFGQLSRMAKFKNREFSITIEDIDWVDKCPILNISLNYYSVGGRVNDTASFDRVDSTKGYVKGNVRIISNRANMIKSDLTFEQIMNMVKYVQ
jgi:hypothetical protein